VKRHTDLSTITISQHFIHPSDQPQDGTCRGCGAHTVRSVRETDMIKSARRPAFELLTQPLVGIYRLISGALVSLCIQGKRESAILIFITAATGCAAAQATPPFFQPDTKAPAHEIRSNPDVRRLIQAALTSDKQLQGLALTVKVDSRAVVLGGKIPHIKERDRALEIGRNYAQGRTVIDDFRMPGE
jgi:hypothetical protein